MAEPQIQYAKTSDAVSIAYSDVGDGPPLVRLGVPGLSHVQRDWTIFPGVVQHLARNFRLISFDQRGTGLSDRSAIDFSMDSMIADFEAVVERAGLDSFSAFAFADSVPIAVTFASRFPARVSNLILVDGWTRHSDYAIDNPAFDAHLALVDKDWTLYTETLGRVLLGAGHPRLVESLGEHIRACVDQDTYRAFGEAVKSYDVSALLPDVEAQTLVLHNSGNGFYSASISQKIAAGIPNARFLTIDDPNYEQVASLIVEFAAGETHEVNQPSAFRTVLFTDVEGSTALTDRLGDERARELLREHERITREALAAHGGSEVKTMGDGFMASFSSATGALECAIAMQRAFAERNARREGDDPSGRLYVRIGLNAGEPIAEDEDLFGTAVNMAARIAAQAAGGEILASNVVRELVAGKGFLFADRGETELRGFEDPVRLYEVRWRED